MTYLQYPFLSSLSLFFILAALHEILEAFHLPENSSKLEEVRVAAGNDMLKAMQTIFPAATQMQIKVIHRYGFLPDGEGDKSIISR